MRAFPNKRQLRRAFWKSVKIIKVATLAVIFSVYPILSAHSQKPIVSDSAESDTIPDYSVKLDTIFLDQPPKTLIIEVTKSEYEKKLEAEQAARKLAATKKVTAPKQVVRSAPIVVSGTNLMAQLGIPESDWKYVDFIINHEAGWNGTLTYNRAGSGAYGICQALPGSKMASAGADWRTNPLTQLRWCNSYALSRYGSWYKAYAFWQANHWW